MDFEIMLKRNREMALNAINEMVCEYEEVIREEVNQITDNTIHELKIISNNMMSQETMHIGFFNMGKLISKLEESRK